MIDDERREVARKLRHEADYWASSGPTDTCLDYTASTVYSVLECIGMRGGYVPIHSMLNRLADLIECPICKDCGCRAQVVKPDDWEELEYSIRCVAGYDYFGEDQLLDDEVEKLMARIKKVAGQ